MFYIDLECILKNYNLVKTTPKNLTQKKARHEPSGWSMFTRCSFDKKENKPNYYRGKDCIEKLCKKLKESAMKIIDYGKKEMIPLTHEKNNFYKEQENAIYAKKSFAQIKMIKII